jgi:two-component system chemotaxis sensor kinase CheA
LTLSIVPTLIVNDGQTDFAIPQTHVIELVRLGGERAAHIEWMEDAAVFRLRGRLLPLVFLRQALRREPPPRSAETAQTLVVLRAGARPFGLVVHRAKDTEEIVEKPLGRHFKGLPFYEGASILGDGRVVPILDVMGLAESAHVISALERTHRLAPPPASAPPAEKREALLLVAGVDDSRAAIPLDRVDRVEEISTAAIERVGGREMIQYRGELLPLHRLSTLLKERRSRPRTTPASESTEALPVVVCRDARNRWGLVVHRILEMVDAAPGDRRPGSRRGVAGTIIARGRITEILDLDILFEPPSSSGGPS